MNLYLIRHADALPVDETIESDEQRPLSDKGKDQSRLLGDALIRRSIQFDIVVTSSLLRAQQTAELMLAGGTHQPKVEVCEDLAPDGKARKVARFVRKLEGEHIALVGHMPQLSEMAGWLIGSRNAGVDFAKASVACIECAEEIGKGGGILVWLVTPKWMA